MSKTQRAQRSTLTYSQMYGMGDSAGLQEGRGIFGKIGKFFKTAFKKVGKFVKDKKIISRITGLAAPIVGALPIPGARIGSAALGIASFLAKQRGLGLPKKIKPISRTQIEAILRGFGTLTASGGLSLARAKVLFPTIKGLSPTQMAALSSFRGRHLRGGGVSLAGGRASGLPMSGMGFSGMGVKLAGQGVKLAGQGVSLAGGRRGAVLARGRAVRLAGGRLHKAPPGFILKPSGRFVKSVLKKKPIRRRVRLPLV